MQSTPTERVLRACLAAYSLHSQRDSRELTAAGRAAFLSKFEKLVDPDGALPEVERERRALAARRAHFTALALRSVRARRIRAAPSG